MEYFGESTVLRENPEENDLDGSLSAFISFQLNIK
jgi:hypothetical protein